MIEIWKGVVGYEDLYLISNFGNVISLPKETKYRHGTIMTKRKLLRPQANSTGYLRLRTKYRGQIIRVFIHRAVASAFIDNPDNKPIVNHIDSNPLNNNVSNLEWVTAKENVHHAMNKGRYEKSFAMTNEKFRKDRESKQKKICATNLVTGEKLYFNTIQEASRIMNLSAGNICYYYRKTNNIYKGYRWEQVE